jgi:putative oxidoreductase
MSVERSLIGLVRATIGGVFLFSGVFKFWDIFAFASAVDGFDILPRFLVFPAAIVLPTLEACCGLSMVTAVGHHTAEAILAFLTLCFSLAIGLDLLRGVVVPCGCFGNILQDSIGPGALVRDVILCAVLVTLARRE